MKKGTANLFGLIGGNTKDKPRKFIGVYNI